PDGRSAQSARRGRAATATGGSSRPEGNGRAIGACLPIALELLTETSCSHSSTDLLGPTRVRLRGRCDDRGRRSSALVVLRRSTHGAECSDGVSGRRSLAPGPPGRLGAAPTGTTSRRRRCDAYGAAMMNRYITLVGEDAEELVEKANQTITNRTAFHLVQIVP